MKIILAADGSKFTKKALAFLTTHESIYGEADELVVVNVQTPVPPRVKALVGSAEVHAFHEEEAMKVLEPIERFLKRHPANFRTEWHVGPPADVILEAVEREKAHLVVMGTHGRGLALRVLMGSVAQKVLTGSPVPVLLVK